MDADGKRTAIIGAGSAGIITAKTLLDDGFDVTVFTRDTHVGGVYAQGRMYPDLTMNNVHGEFNFSSLPMPPPKNSRKTGGRLYGQDVQDYMESFANWALKGRINFGKEVLSIHRPANGVGWIVEFRDIKSNIIQEELFHKVILCTGGCSNPNIPTAITASMAKAAGFDGPVVHSSEFAREHDNIMSLLESSRRKVVGVGGGKSAMDIATYLSKQDFNVTMVFEKFDTNIAVSTPLPSFIRRSRLLVVMSPHIELNTRLERFLHTTAIGAFITRGFWNALHWSSLKVLKVSPSTPLMPTHHAYWTIHFNDLGQPTPEGFYAQFSLGKINVVAPGRLAGYAKVAKTQYAVLSDGRKLEADAVVLATGFTSSWNSILSAAVRKELWLEPYDLEETGVADNYTSLRNPPSRPSLGSSFLMHRTVVPIGNLEKRDFAVNGAALVTANGPTHEMSAHWISSYFLRDTFLRVPDAIVALWEARRNAQFVRCRFPDTWAWANESYSAGILAWNWPQLVDSMLSDMGLRTIRSGGSWFNWIFKVIDANEIVNLGEERKSLRQASLG